MRNITLYELRQIGNMRRVQLDDSIMAQIKQLSIAQSPKLILLQRAYPIAVKVDGLHFLQMLKCARAQFGDVTVADVKSLQSGRQKTLVEFVIFKLADLMSIDLQNLEIAENLKGVARKVR